MEELFKKQLEVGEPITEERVNQLLEKNYFDGTEIKPGHVVLYGFMFEGQDGDDFNFKMIKMNESHFNMFDVFEEFNGLEGQIVPYIKLKK